MDVDPCTVTNQEASYSCVVPMLGCLSTDLDHWKQKAGNGDQQGPQGVQGRANQSADQ